MCHSHPPTRETTDELTNSLQALRKCSPIHRFGVLLLAVSGAKFEHSFSQPSAANSESHLLLSVSCLFQDLPRSVLRHWPGNLPGFCYSCPKHTGQDTLKGSIVISHSWSILPNFISHTPLFMAEIDNSTLNPFSLYLDAASESGLTQQPREDREGAIYSWLGVR